MMLPNDEYKTLSKSKGAKAIAFRPIYFAVPYTAQIRENKDRRILLTQAGRQIQICKNDHLKCS
jgi:hypothetical protein